MKVIFCDVDGVIVSQDSLYAVQKGNGEYRRSESFDRNCVARLKHLIETTKASLVISSTWRIGCMIDNLTAAFIELGLPYWIGTTPILAYTGKGSIPRGIEIKEWLDNHPEVTNYVILDDDSDMLQEQLPHFVHTKFRTGLTDADVQKAMEILG